jgi:hypothetical protein
VFYTKTPIFCVKGKAWLVKKNRSEAENDTYSQTGYLQNLIEEQSGVEDFSVKRFGNAEKLIITTSVKVNNQIVDYLKDKGFDAFISKGKFIKAKNPADDRETLGYSVVFGKDFLNYYDLIECQVISKNLLGLVTVKDLGIGLISLFQGLGVPEAAESEDEPTSIDVYEETLRLKKDANLFANFEDVGDEMATLLEVASLENVETVEISERLEVDVAEIFDSVGLNLLKLYNRNFSESDSFVKGLLQSAWKAEFENVKESWKQETFLKRVNSKIEGIFRKTLSKETLIDELTEYLTDGSAEVANVKRAEHIINSNYKLDVKDVFKVEYEAKCIANVFYYGVDNAGRKTPIRKRMTETEVFVREYMFLCGTDQKYINFLLSLKYENIEFTQSNRKKYFGRNFNEKSRNDWDSQSDYKPYEEAYSDYKLKFKSEKQYAFKIFELFQQDDNLSEWLEWLVRLDALGGKGYVGVLNRDYSERWAVGAIIKSNIDLDYYKVSQKSPTILRNLLTGDLRVKTRFEPVKTIK